MSKSKNKTLQDFPRYVSAVTRDNDLRGELAEINRQIDEVSAATGNKEWLSANEEAAHRLVYGDGADAPDDQPNLADLHKQRQVLTRAVELSAKEIAEARAEASAEICAPLKPQHRANVAATVTAALALADALDTEETLRRGLEAQDVAYLAHLRPMQLYGTAEAFRERVKEYAAECGQHGLA